MLVTNDTSISGLIRAGMIRAICVNLKNTFWRRTQCHINSSFRMHISNIIQHGGSLSTKGTEIWCKKLKGRLLTLKKKTNCCSHSKDSSLPMPKKVAWEWLLDSSIEGYSSYTINSNFLYTKHILKQFNFTFFLLLLRSWTI